MNEFRQIEVSTGTEVEYYSQELIFLAISGQPYRGSIYVHFTTKSKVMNLMDFKKFITSLRDITLPSENIAQYIFDKIIEYTNEDLGIIVKLTARGGIQQTIKYGDSFSIETNKKNVFQV